MVDYCELLAPINMTVWCSPLMFYWEWLLLNSQVYRRIHGHCQTILCQYDYQALVEFWCCSLNIIHLLLFNMSTWSSCHILHLPQLSLFLYNYKLTAVQTGVGVHWSEIQHFRSQYLYTFWWNPDMLILAGSTHYAR